MNKLLIVIVFLYSSQAMAGFYGGSVAGGAYEAQQDAACTNAMRAATQAMQAYAQCLNSTNNAASCGAAPTYPVCQSSSQASPAAQPAKATDYKCMSDCTSSGYGYLWCKSRCSYQP